MLWVLIRTALPCLSEVLLLSTKNIYFPGEVRKISVLFVEKSTLSGTMRIIVYYFGTKTLFVGTHQ